jgi:hypothetical protein
LIFSSLQKGQTNTCFLSPFKTQVAAQETVRQLSDTIAYVDVVDLSFRCGRDFEPIASSLDVMMNILSGLEKSARSGLNLLSCERIVPIYTDIVYEGTCDHSVTGLSWMFACLLIVATMGMIMITLRSSFQNSRLESDDTKKRSDDDSEFDDMHKMQHRNGQSSTFHESQDKLDAGWQDAALRIETSSDTGSVYTNGFGELTFAETDTGECRPKATAVNALYAHEDDSYDDFGDHGYDDTVVIDYDDDDYAERVNPKPSAPHAMYDN